MFFLFYSLHLACKFVMLWCKLVILLCVQLVFSSIKGRFPKSNESHAQCVSYICKSTVEISFVVSTIKKTLC